MSIKLIAARKFDRNMSSPIRLKLFTSKNCKFCPQVDAIVRQVVGSAFGKSVFVNTVDTDLYPKIAADYGITSLPSVMIDQDIVLTGMVKEAEIKDKLMNTLFNAILSRSGEFQGKENLLGITQHLVNSFTKRTYLREHIGDYVHLSIIQMINISILSLDHLAKTMVFEAGKNVGKYGPGQMFLYTLNTEIHKYYKISLEKFKQIMIALESYYSNPPEIPILAVDSAELVSVTRDEAILRLYGSSLATGVPEVGEPLCDYIAGEIAGLVEVMLGKYVDVEETHCFGLGDKYCEFKITLYDTEVIKEIFQEKDKTEVSTRRKKFLSILTQILTTHHDSLFMNKILRKRGDYVHISLLQQIISALKETDEFTAMLLYSAGFEFGKMSQKESLSREIWKNNFSLPLTFEDATATVAKAFEFPTDVLRRQNSFADHKIIDEETAEITLHECCYSSGFENRGKTYCDYSAGFIAGRLSLIYNQPLIVEETKCHGNGHQYCTFRITLD